MNYSELNIKDCKEIIKQYEVGELLSCNVLNGGLENSNYSITTTNGKFVLTVCERKSVKQTENLTKLLAHLSDYRFKSSKIVADKRGAYMQLWDGKPVLIKEYIDGHVVEGLSTSLIQLVGRQLAELHQIEVPSFLESTFSYGLEHFHLVSKYAGESEFYNWLLDTEAYILQYLNEELPKSLIHSDLFDNNVIVSCSEDEVTIMDFEEAGHYYRLFDIGMAVVGLCVVNDMVDLEKMRTLLLGYQDVDQLKPKERESLQAFIVYAAAVTAAWRHRQFNFVSPDSQLSNHYLKMKAIADSVRMLSPSTFI